MRTPQTVAGLVALVAVAGLLETARPARAQSTHAAEAAQIMKADADFAQAVAGKDRARFLSFLAEVTTFNGGSPSELHGRDAVMKEWNDFFTPDGPTLSWTPARGEVVGAGTWATRPDNPSSVGRAPTGRRWNAGASTSPYGGNSGTVRGR